MATQYIDPPVGTGTINTDWPIKTPQKVTYLGKDDQFKLLFDNKTKYCVKCQCGYVLNKSTPRPHQCHFYRWRVLELELEITPTSRVPKVILWLEFGKRLNTSTMRKKWRKEGGYYLPSWLSGVNKTVFVPCTVGEVMPPVCT